MHMPQIQAMTAVHMYYHLHTLQYISYFTMTQKHTNHLEVVTKYNTKYTYYDIYF